jgi:N-acetylmuramoyl-L-alanine amidase
MLTCLTLVVGGGPVQAARHKGPLQGQVIVVDAGHGGRDNGASAAGLDEKDLVLRISRETAAALRSAGARVVESRQADDNLVPRGVKTCNLQRKNLEARVELATRHDAGIFLSIHANKYGDPSVHGAQVFIGENPDAERQLLGSCLYSEMSALSGSRRQLDMTRDLYLMRHLKIPAALIEVGFISNPAERARMLQPGYQKQIADAITRGVTCFVRGRSALKLAPSPHAAQAQPAPSVPAS